MQIRTNFGLLVKATNENTPDIDVRFRSSQALSDVPYLENQYTRDYIANYYLKDHLGNIRVTFTETGTVNEKTDYYPFGLQFNKTGDENKFLYNGKEFEDDFDLNWYHYGVRYYDPRIARWNVVDPAREFASPYVFNANSPLNGYDKNGQVAWFIAAAVIGAFQGATHAQYNHQTFAEAVFWGAVTGVASAAVGQGLSSIYEPVGLFAGIGYGGISGGITSGLSSLAQGGNFSDGFGFGALMGGFSGGAAGWNKAISMGLDPITLKVSDKMQTRIAAIENQITQNDRIRAASRSVAIPKEADSELLGNVNLMVEGKVLSRYELAETLIGTPYQRGGCGSSGMDCTGLDAFYKYGELNAQQRINLKITSSDQSFPDRSYYYRVYPSTASPSAFKNDLLKEDYLIWRGVHAAYYSNGTTHNLLHAEGSGGINQVGYTNNLFTHYIPTYGYPEVYRPY